MAVVTNAQPPTEGVRHLEPNTCAVIKQRDLGKGTLYIAESQLVWVGEKGEGLTLEYPTISVHAVSRDLNSYPQECLVVMTCPEEDEQKVENSNSSGDEDDDDDDLGTEIRFIPENSVTLDTMFKAMSECQALHSVDDDGSSCNGEDDGNEDDDEEDGEFEIAAGDPGHQVTTASDGDQDGEPMDIGQVDEELPEH